MVKRRLKSIVPRLVSMGGRELGYGYLLVIVRHNSAWSLTNQRTASAVVRETRTKQLAIYSSHHDMKALLRRTWHILPVVSQI